MRIIRLKRFWFILLIPVSFLLTEAAGRLPAFTEAVYSRGAYRYLSQACARLTGWVPFSLAECLLLLAAAVILGYLTVSITKIAKAPVKLEGVFQLCATLLCIVSLIVFGFTVICGLNYHRLTFAEESGFTVRPSSAEELAALCGELTGDLNEAAGQVRRDGGGVMVHSFNSYYHMAQAAAGAYPVMNEEFPALGGSYYPRPKPVVFSRAMSLADIVGVYFPFTFEANVNVDIPDYEIPSAMLHELAHFKGFMREDEANFLAYLACRENENADFVYSGYMLAFLHSSNALYEADPDAFWSVIERLSPLARADFNAHYLYWKQFEGPISAFSEKVNDVYLKTNRQAQGVKSYGRMVDLLLADYRKRHEIS